VRRLTHQMTRNRYFYRGRVGKGTSGVTPRWRHCALRCNRSFLFFAAYCNRRPTIGRFGESRISFASLRHLTGQDFEDIDVLLGYRRTMPAAIEDLDGPAGVQRARLTQVHWSFLVRGGARQRKG
jgi:hypothetical protein